MKKNLSLKKELPMATSPINYYMRFTIPLSIAFLDDDFLKFFLTTHLQINAKKNGKYLNIYSQYIPSVRTRISLRLRKKKMNVDRLVDHLLVKLNEENYIGIHLDWYDIPGNASYERKHFSHREYIYGYDLEKKEFLMIGYSDNQAIERYRLSFEQLKVAAYDSRQLRTLWEIEYFKHKPNVKYRFNFNLLVLGIKSYYNSTLPLRLKFHAQSYHLTKRERVLKPLFEHGMDTHKYLRKLVMDEFEGKDRKTPMVLIKLCGFYEFKQCMLLRLKYIQNNGYVEDINDIINRYEKIVEWYGIFKKMYLKYMLSENAEPLFRMFYDMEVQEQVEREILKDLIEKLSSAKKRKKLK